VVTELPPVTELDAGADREWFLTHPGRRFHARPAADGWWLIRKLSETFIRTFTRDVVSVADRDKDIAALWFAAAYPESLFNKSARKGRKAVGGRR
jgi:hypothetical protein